MSIIPYERSFASNEKSVYWSNRNGDIKPKDVVKSSKTHYWFDCKKCKHSFNASLTNINNGNWCSFCSNKQLCKDDSCKICFNRSFASNEKSKFWSDKNEKKPRDVYKSSSKKYYFNCDKCFHIINISLNKVTIGQWCSFCTNNQICEDDSCIICFNKSFASSEKSIYWSDKNDEKPRKLFKSSDKKYWFKCVICVHDFDIALNNVNNGSWCPFCSNKKLCNLQNCKLCFDKSFASNEKSICWSKKNGDIKPRDIFKSSHKICYFDCDICGHVFDTILTNNNWCPFCSNRHRRLCDEQNCELCFNKSFASNEKNIYWSDKNGDIKPREVFKSSDKKYLFNCGKCNHDFNMALSNITKGGWCPFCSNQKLCENELCELCFNNSFASNEKSIYWSNKNGDIKPRKVFKSSDKRYWLNCVKCNNSFNTQISNINKGSWCPYCVNKTETILYEKLLSVYPNIQRQFKQDWCKKINHLPFDFCIIEHKIIIELDGNQHFHQVMNWDSPENQFENDKYKEKCANDNGYSVIRIIQEDVFYNKYDWYKELCDAIGEIVNNNKIINVYMCKNGEYDKFL